MSTFHRFAQAIAKRFAFLSKHELYTTDTGQAPLAFQPTLPVAPLGKPVAEQYRLDENTYRGVYGAYLAAFPEGTNPLFRERTEHDCSTCRSFIKNVGHVVAIIDGQVETVWGGIAGGSYGDVGPTYQSVALTLNDLVRSLPINGVFRTTMPYFGAESTLEVRDGNTHRWYHFVATIAKRHITASPGSAIGEAQATVDVLRRGLEELTLEALDTAIELIEAKAVYRGDEFLPNIVKFRETWLAYPRHKKGPGTAAELARAQELFLWSRADDMAGRFRNTAVGTFLVDLSSGMGTQEAIDTFGKKTDPVKYKRPTAAITQRMIDDALKKLDELGLSDAVERRLARLSDVDINDVIWADGGAAAKMKDVGGLRGKLLEAAEPAQVAASMKDAQEMPIGEFLKLLPRAKSLEMLVENRHVGNFVTLTAPVHAGAGRLFKWNNDFGWSYDGGVADSLKQKVAALGGRVDGVLRFSHMWNYDRERPNKSLMDLHVFFPGAPRHEDGCHDMYPTLASSRSGGFMRVGWNALRPKIADPLTGGVQDVDRDQIPDDGDAPVENITFPTLSRMPEGTYVLKIHNWNERHPNQSGVKAEVEFEGRVYNYEIKRPFKNKEWITIARVTLSKGKFTIEHVTPESSAGQKKWGLMTETLVPVDTILKSPNHWGDQAIGNLHTFFVLRGCKTDAPARGMYNEFLRPEFEQHRKVFEVLGAKTKCPVTDDQLSGLGFSSTNRETVTVLVRGDKFSKAVKIVF